jgi:hypothetical protein
MGVWRGHLGTGRVGLDEYRGRTADKAHEGKARDLPVKLGQTKSTATGVSLRPRLEVVRAET